MSEDFGQYGLGKILSAGNLCGGGLRMYARHDMEVIEVSHRGAAGQGRLELRWPLVRRTTDGHRMTVET